MKKTFLKTIARMFKSNLTRFITNMFIIVISLTIITGLSSLKGNYIDNLNSVYLNSNLSDITIMKNSQNGFTQEEISSLQEVDEIADFSNSFTNDYSVNNKIYRINYLDTSTTINKLTLLEGRLPNKSDEIVILKPNSSTINYNINDKITIEYKVPILSIQTIVKKDYIVVGTVLDPYYNSIALETSYLNKEGEDSLKVDSFIYLDSKYNTDFFYDNIFPKIKLSLTLKDRNSYFASNYFSYVEKVENKLKEKIGEDNLTYLDLNSNTTYALFKENMEKINNISFVFPILFILVCLLTNLITITRLIDEERSIIGIYVSLGIKKIYIYIKYLSFSFLSSILGVIFGICIGIYLLPTIIYKAILNVFYLGELHIGFHFQNGIVIGTLLVLLIIIMTISLTFNMLKEKPCELLKYKAPKPGKRILLEKVPFIWNKLSFKYKSSIRNIFRYKKNFYLTLFSILGSYILLFIGFSLLDVTISLVNDPLYGNLLSSMKLISLVIILFAIGMCLLIVYNLANMNIFEREREIATLKVLGYTDIECSFYTFREILITTILSLIVSIPVGYLLDMLVFNYLDFGSVSEVKFTSYIYSILIIIVLSLIINFILFPKIKKIDMNKSLKSLE